MWVCVCAVEITIISIGVKETNNKKLSLAIKAPDIRSFVE